jgi:hypothetical protein
MLHMPFWLSLFVGNVASVLLLSWLVPWTVKRFGWWLQPAAQDAGRTDWVGAGLIAALYGVAMLVFSHL